MIHKMHFRLLALSVVVLLCGLNCLAQDDLGFYLLKTKTGYLLVQNGRQISFTIEFKGEKIEPLESDHPKFIIDNKPVQVVTVPLEEFWKPKTDSQTEPADEELLELHKIWESAYLGEAMKTKLSVTSQIFEITPKRKLMFWSFPAPKDPDSLVSHYLFLTTVTGKVVLGLNSGSATVDAQSACRAYLVESMKTLKTSDKPFNIKKLAGALASNNPAD